MYYVCSFPSRAIVHHALQYTYNIYVYRYVYLYYNKIQFYILYNTYLYIHACSLSPVRTSCRLQWFPGPGELAVQHKYLSCAKYQIPPIMYVYIYRYVLGEGRRQRIYKMIAPHYKQPLHRVGGHKCQVGTPLVRIYNISSYIHILV